MRTDIAEALEQFHPVSRLSEGVRLGYVINC